MNLNLPLDIASPYKSASQRARVVTESWLAENMYCAACSSKRLEPTRHNTEAVDFICPECEASYQLKATSKPIRTRVVDAGYDAMIRALLSSRLPHFLVMQYTDCMINDFLILPKFAIPASAIEARKPLASTARRAGWVGCNLLLTRIPNEGRIQVINKGLPRPANDVRADFSALRALDKTNARARGWTLDTLTSLRSLQRPVFSIQDAYSLEPGLQALHPENHHVRPKIRQQLQILRDLGHLEFLGRGMYKWCHKQSAAVTT